MDQPPENRFEFGRNWAHFLAHVDEARICTAERELASMLEVADLRGKSFLDVGSGSGLMSLAALRLGATVHSFDVDPRSVSCTAELRRRHAPNEPGWKVEHASILDEAFVRSLSPYDVVYSWGVLHHTGRMWQALSNVALPVAPGGKLFIAIYNDQGDRSSLWRAVKRTCVALPQALQGPFVFSVALPLETAKAVKCLLLLRPQEYLRRWTRYSDLRGMSKWYDLVDWVGGYPFEVATPDALFAFYRSRGFALERLVTVGGSSANNQMVFSRPSR